MCLFFCFWRSACRPISLSLNTGFWRPISPFGLNTGFGYAIAPFGAIRSAYRPISPNGLNTGSLSSRGCAPLTPGCILAPFQGALFPLAIFVTSAVGRCPFPLAIFVTSAVGRCPFPLAIYGEGGGRQAGGEVRQAGGMVKTPLMERPPPIFN